MNISRIFCCVALLSVFGMGCSKSTLLSQPVPDLKVDAPIQNPSPTADEIQEQQLGILETNGAEVRVTHNNIVQSGQNGAFLFAGDSVDVTSGTAQIIYLGAGASAIPAGSKVTLLQNGSGEHTVYTRVILEAGSIWTRFERLLGSDEHFSVNGNGVVATVRGTAFGMQLDGRAADVQVGEHVVDVTMFSPENEPIKKSIDVKEGRALKIDTDTFLKMDHDAMEKRIRALDEKEKKTFGFNFLKKKLPDSVMRPGVRSNDLPAVSERVIRVLNRAGQPIQGASVTIFSGANIIADDKQRVGLGDASAKTNSKGLVAFRLDTPRTYTYRVTFKNVTNPAPLLQTGSLSTPAKEPLVIVLVEPETTAIVPPVAPPAIVPVVTSTPPISPVVKVPSGVIPTKLIVHALGSTSLTTGQSSPLEAKMEYSDGSIHYVTPQCAWSTSNPLVGIVQNARFLSLSAIGSSDAICQYTEADKKYVAHVTFNVSLDPQLQPTFGSGSELPGLRAQ